MKNSKPEIRQLSDMPKLAHEFGLISKSEKEAEESIIETLKIGRVRGTIRELNQILKIMLTAVTMASLMEPSANEQPQAEETEPEPELTPETKKYDA